MIFMFGLSDFLHFLHFFMFLGASAAGPFQIPYLSVFESLLGDFCGAFDVQNGAFFLTVFLIDFRATFLRKTGAVALNPGVCPAVRGAISPQTPL